MFLAGVGGWGLVFSGGGGSARLRRRGCSCRARANDGSFVWSGRRVGRFALLSTSVGGWVLVFSGVFSSYAPGAGCSAVHSCGVGRSHLDARGFLCSWPASVVGFACFLAVGARLGCGGVDARVEHEQTMALLFGAVDGSGGSRYFRPASVVGFLCFLACSLVAEARLGGNGVDARVEHEQTMALLFGAVDGSGGSRYFRPASVVGFLCFLACSLVADARLGGNGVDARVEHEQTMSSWLKRSAGRALRVTFDQRRWLGSCVFWRVL